MLRLLNLIAATGGLALALGISTVSTSASTVPDAVYHQEIFFPVGSNFFGPGSVGPVQQAPPAPADLSYTGSGVTAGVSASNTSHYNVPSLEVHATVPSITGLAGGIVQLQLTYFIRFNGPSGTVDVPVQANGSASLATSSLLAFANAFLSITNLDASDIPLPQVTALCDLGSPCGPSGTSFSVNRDLPFVEGDLYQVEMTSAIGNIDNNLTASAFVDPFFDTPLGYTLDISQGIGNSPLSSTPLPAALPLFATGLGGLGFFGWRRKRKAHAIAA